MKSLVSIVVCTRNNPSLLRHCLASIGELSYARRELIVVDNNSTAANAEQVKRIVKEHGGHYLYGNIDVVIG